MAFCGGKSNGNARDFFGGSRKGFNSVVAPLAKSSRK
jgi:hypothetical protein